jgi:hypothetical protein
MRGTYPRRRTEPDGGLFHRPGRDRKQQWRERGALVAAIGLQRCKCLWAMAGVARLLVVADPGP